MRDEARRMWDAIDEGAPDAEIYAAYAEFVKQSMARLGYVLDEQRGEFVHRHTGKLYGEDPEGQGI